MSAPVSQRGGRPLPLGATLDENGCNFSLYSSVATAVDLCLFNAAGQQTKRIPMHQRTGPIWHVYLSGVRAGQRYAYRVQGPHAPEQGLYCAPEKLLIDPYARCLSDTLRWHESLEELGENKSCDSLEHVPRSLVIDPRFDWQGHGFQANAGPRVEARRRSIYEVHVKGFTQMNPALAPELRGRYLGLCAEPSLRYLKALGVTTLQIMPCFSFMTEARLLQLGLSNYWGYNPVSFFAPDWRYAIDDPVREFKTMVRELHRAGFEVVLDVVYNHTAEGEVGQGSFCFKGLDSPAYYQARQVWEGQDLGAFANHSGCGNTLNTAHPQVVRLILDSLRYWRTEMGLDGFRFDLATVLGRHGDAFSPQHPLLAAIEADPALSTALMIAEPWDIGPNGYQLGRFAGRWLEVNDRYRDDLRRFWRGDTVGVAELATRIMGSRDIFEKSARPEYASVNHICYHDGFTLHDLASYERRHNQANGEDNRDGHGHNFSCNFGVEGPSTDPAVEARRDRYKRNLLSCLILSRGTPHLLAGDECGHSQAGNNNAYCQDNPVSWFDWNTRDDGLFAFTQACLALRARGLSLNALNIADETYHARPFHHVLKWCDETGKAMSAEQWQEAARGFLALFVQARDVSESYQLLINRTDRVVIWRGSPQTCEGQPPEVLLCTGDWEKHADGIALPVRSVTLCCSRAAARREGSVSVESSPPDEAA